MKSLIILSLMSIILCLTVLAEPIVINESYFIPTKYAEKQDMWEDYNHNFFNSNEIKYVLTLTFLVSAIHIIGR